MSFALAPAFRLTDWQSFNFRILLFIAKLGYFCTVLCQPITFYLNSKQLFASVNIAHNNLLLTFRINFRFYSITHQLFAFTKQQLFARTTGVNR